MSERGGRDRRPEQTGELLHIIGAGETRRFLADTHLEPDPRRVADGWERRFMAEGTRAEEMTELYRNLGFEVVADPVQTQGEHGGCEQCRLLMELRFKVIYTRRPPSRSAG